MTDNNHWSIKDLYDGNVIFTCDENLMEKIDFLEVKSGREASREIGWVFIERPSGGFPGTYDKQKLLDMLNGGEYLKTTQTKPLKKRFLTLKDATT